jgi:hypothetical protein
MAAFQLRNNLTIYGGFAGDEPADFDVNQRDIEGNPTILSGDIDKDGLLDGENSLHVVFNNENGLDATAVLDGFTISGGLANGERLPHERGGGMFNRAVSPTIRNCTFTGMRPATTEAACSITKPLQRSSTACSLKIPLTWAVPYTIIFIQHPSTPTVPLLRILA